MILGRLREHQDESSLAGALVKGGFVVVKAGKLVLALVSYAAYAFLFTWQFAVIAHALAAGQQVLITARSIIGHQPSVGTVVAGQPGCPERTTPWDD
jgi:hypothetical protein